MSALPCGCDTESLWMCEEHRPKTGTVQQFKDRLENADAMADTSATDGSVNVIIESRLPSLAEQFHVEAVRIAKQTPMPPNFKALTEGAWPSNPSPAEQPRAEAVLIESGQPSYGTTAYIGAPVRKPVRPGNHFAPAEGCYCLVCEAARLGTPAEQFRAQAVATAAAVETRDDLLNRIATLEADLDRERSRGAQRRHDSSYLLDMERYEHERTKERIVRVAEREAHIAAVLATFYTEPLSLSSVQPLIALALELNPDLVERAR